MNKTTPPNCKEQICSYNRLPPPPNSQECVGCDGNRNPKWKPAARTRKP